MRLTFAPLDFGTSRRPRHTSALFANIQIAALAFLIWLGNAAETRADMAPGTYVTPGLGVILRVAPCQTSGAGVCAEIMQGAAKVQGASRASHMMPPYRGKGWRYLALNAPGGDQIGWLRALGQDRVEILRCRGAACNRTTWQSLGTIDSTLRNVPRIAQVLP